MDAGFNIPNLISFEAEDYKYISILEFIARLSHHNAFFELLKPVFCVLQYMKLSTLSPTFVRLLCYKHKA